MHYLPHHSAPSPHARPRAPLDGERLVLRQLHYHRNNQLCSTQHSLKPIYPTRPAHLMENASSFVSLAARAPVPASTATRTFSSACTVWWCLLEAGGPTVDARSLVLDGS